MDIKLPFDFSLTPMNLMRRCGYSPAHTYNSKAENYVKLISRDNYPRFHIYLDQDDNQTVLKIHLDQKKPSYAGAHAHNADYDGEPLEREVSRITSIINQVTQA